MEILNAEQRHNNNINNNNELFVIRMEKLDH